MILYFRNGRFELCRNGNDKGRTYNYRGADNLEITIRNTYRGRFTVTPDAQRELDAYRSSRREKTKLERMAS